MPSPSNTPRTQIHRKPQRAHHEAATIRAIIDEALVCQIAFNQGGSVHCLPMACWREGDFLYIHGANNSRLTQTLLDHECAVSITHLDGLVLARSAFNHSANFRCAMVFGKAHLVDDAAEKERALYAVTDRLFPGRNAELRPMTTQEIKATSVVRMEIEEASAKVRGVNVGDDEEDGIWPVWAGVIPVTTVIGHPEPSPVLPDTIPLPAHLSAFAAGRALDTALQDSFTRWQEES